MPIKIRKTLLHEPITFDTIGNHWDQVPIYRPNGYPLYHYLQTEKGVGKIEIQGKSYLLLHLYLIPMLKKQMNGLPCLLPLQELWKVVFLKH